MDFYWLQGTERERLPAFANSLAIGRLMGLERERHPGTNAGLRTFALTALFAAMPLATRPARRRILSSDCEVAIAVVLASGANMVFKLGMVLVVALLFT